MHSIGYINDWLVDLPDHGWSLKKLTDLLKKSLYTLRIIRFEHEVSCSQNNDSVLGFLIAQWVGSEATLIYLAVNPEHMRKNVAGCLMRDFLAMASKQNIEHVLLEVRESNQAAISLYTQYGFLQVGRRPNYYAPVSNTIAGSPSTAKEAALLYTLKLL